MNDGTVIDTSIFIAGEAYRGIDLETKQIFGF